MPHGDDDSQNMASDLAAMTLQEAELQTTLRKAPPLHVVLASTDDQTDTASFPSSSSADLIIPDGSNNISGSASVVSSTDNFSSIDELQIQLLSLLTLPSGKLIESNDFVEENQSSILTKINDCLDKRLFLLRTYLELEKSTSINLLLSVYQHTLVNEIFVQDVDMLRENIVLINELTLLALQKKSEGMIKRLINIGRDSTHIIESLKSILSSATPWHMLHLSDEVDKAQSFITNTNLRFMNAKIRIDEKLINNFADFIIDEMMKFFIDEIDNVIQLILINDHSVTERIFIELMNISYKTKVIWNLICVMLKKSGVLPEFMYINQGLANRFNEEFIDTEAKMALTSLNRKITQLLKINEISGKEGDGIESRFANTVHWLTLLTPYETSQPLISDAAELAEDVINRYKTMGENLKSHYVALIEDNDYQKVFPQKKMMTMLGNLMCYLQQQAIDYTLSPNPYKKALTQAISGFDATVEQIAKGKQDTKLMMAVFEAYVQPIRSLLSAAPHKHPLPRYDSLPLGDNRLGSRASPHRYSLPSTSSPVLFPSSSSDKPPALKVSISASPSTLRRPDQVSSSSSRVPPRTFFSGSTSGVQLLSLGFGGLEQWSLAMGQIMSGDMLSPLPPSRKG